jgi:hypothetical protein
LDNLDNIPFYRKFTKNGARKEVVASGTGDRGSHESKKLEYQRSLLKIDNRDPSKVENMLRGEDRKKGIAHVSRA